MCACHHGSVTLPGTRCYQECLILGDVHHLCVLVSFQPCTTTTALWTVQKVPNRLYGVIGSYWTTVPAKPNSSDGGAHSIRN